MKRKNVFTFKLSKKIGICPLFHVKWVVSLGGNAFFPSNSQSAFQKQKMQLNKFSLTLCSRDLLIAWSANFVLAQWRHMETPKNENNRNTQWKERWLFVHNPGLRFTNDPEAIESQFERIDDVIMGGRYHGIPLRTFGIFWVTAVTSPGCSAGPVPVPGLSRSSLSPCNLGASWRGVLRSEGGGFCGQRTRPCLVVSIVILWFEEYISKLLYII